MFEEPGRQPPPPPRRRGRRWLRRAALALLLLVAGLLAVLHLPPVQRSLAERGLDVLRDRQNLDIRYSDLRFNLLTRRVRIDDLVVGGAGAPVPLVTADQAFVRFPYAAFGGRVDGLNVTLSGVRVNLIRDDDRFVSVPAAWTRPREPGGRPARIPAFEAIRLNDTTVVYEDRDAGFGAVTRNLSVDLLPAGEGEPGRLSGALAPGARTTVRLDSRGTTLTLRSGQAWFSPAGAGVDGLVLDSPEGRFTSDVRYRFQGDDRFALTASGALRADQLSPWFAALETAEGAVDVELTMPAEGGAPAFADVVVEAPSLRWRGLEFRELNAAGPLGTRAIALDRARVRIGPGQIEGTARLAWADGEESRASLRGRDIDLRDTLTTLFPDSDAVARFTPGSLISGTFDASWEAWRAAALAGRARTTWRPRPARARGDAAMRAGGRIDVQFRRGPWIVDTDVRINDAFDVRGQWTTLASRADFSDWPLEGTLATTGETPGLIDTGLALFETEPPVDLTQAGGRTSGVVALAGGLADPMATAALEGTIAWPDQPTIAFETRTVADADAVRVESFTARSGPSDAEAALTIDLERDTFDGTFSARDVPVEAWLRRFDLGVPVAGPVDADGRISGPLRDYVIEADVHGGPMTVAGQSFEAVETHVRYDGETLEATGLRASRGCGSVAGAIRWNRDTGALDGALEVTALPFAATIPGLPYPEDAPPGAIAFEVSGRVALGGTTGAPAVEADLTAPAVTLGAHAFGAFHLQAAPAGDGTVAVELRAPDLGASATGSVRLDGDVPFDASLRVETGDSPLAATVRALTMELGAMQLEAQVTGTARGLQIESATIGVARLDGVILDRTTDPSNGQVLLTFGVDPDVDVTWRDDTLAVDGAIAAGRTRLTASGRLGEPGSALTLALDGTLEDLRALALRFAPDSLRHAQVSGTVTMRAQASGALDRPALTGSLDVSDALLGDGTHPPLQDVTLRIVLADDTFRIEQAEARWQGAHVEVTGTVPAWFAGLPGAGRDVPPASLTGHVDDVTLDVLEPFVPAEALQATSFESEVAFTLGAAEPSLDALTGDVVIRRAVLKSRELGLAQRQPARLRLSNGVLTLEPWTIGAPWSVATAVTVAGTVRLPDGERPAAVDVRAAGPLDLRGIGLLLGTYRPDGRAVVDLHVDGTLPSPAVNGVVEVDGAELLVGQPRLAFSDVSGVIRFADDQLVVERFDGALNGGTVDVSGAMRQPWLGGAGGALDVAARGVLVDIRGLRAALDADLTFQEREADERFALEGTVTIVQAAYRETLLLTGGLVSLLSPGADAVIVPEEQRDAPDWLVLDLRVLARDSISVDTTYGEFVAGANLRVAGTPAAPRVLGAIDLAPGGQLFFGGRRYRIEAGRVEFRGASFLRPQIRLLAHTTIGGYEVTLNVQSEGDTIDTTLTSDPPLPEADIASLMLSGQRRPTGDPGELVTEQLLAALSGEIVGAVGRAIGFDSVRLEQANPGDLLIDASLISSDSNPSQRLTFSKRVFPDLEVIVSQSLRESGDVTWVVSWQPLRNLELRVVQLDDNDRSYEVRHDLSFGGGQPRPRRTRATREVVRAVDVEVRGSVGEAQVRDRIDIEAGDRVDFYEWQRARERVETWLFERGFYEAAVTVRRETAETPAGGGPTPVTLRYVVETGPPTALRVTGVDVPDAIRGRLAQTWADIAVDGLLEDAFVDVLRPWLAEQGYLQPEAAMTLSLVEGVKTATIFVSPGPRFTDRQIDIRGNEGLSRGAIVDAVEQAGLRDTMWTQPARLRALLLALYRRNGYLAADVDVLEPEFAGNTARLPVRIEEGPRFRAGSVRIEGVTEVPDVDLDPPIWEGAILTDRSVAEALRDLERRFRQAGYRGTRVTAESYTRPDGATVDLVFNVLLGGRLRVEEIRIAGNDAASDALIARTLDLDPGEPIVWERIGRARDRLYDTGLFRTVTLEVEPLPAAEAGAAGRAVAQVTVEELPRYRLRYGFQLFDPISPVIDPRWGRVDPGVVADLTRRGLFGRGVTGGVGARINSSERAVRGYLSSRTFFGLPVQTNLFVSEDREKTVSAGNVLDSRSRGFTLDQRIRWRQLFQFGYGYNFERRVFDFLLTVPALPLPITVPVEVRADIGRVFGNLVLDDRDNVLDTRQGGFHSSSFELGPEALGSTLGFRKYLTQNFYFVPWKRVTFGTAARLEFADGPGRGLITTERLRVGGSNTVRGYEDDTLQLQNLTTAVEGTTAILVLNQEVRFPIWRRVMGTTFWDYAHIYGERGDFTGLTVRNSLGGGLRLLLPFIVLRVDYGYPVNQDERNDSGRWYFAIGQAF